MQKTCKFIRIEIIPQYSFVIIVPICTQILKPDSENKIKFIVPQLIFGPFIGNVVHQTSFAHSGFTENENLSGRLLAEYFTYFYLFFGF
jgi:putative salt-induced outer membrane protein YdiY